MAPSCVLCGSYVGLIWVLFGLDSGFVLVLCGCYVVAIRVLYGFGEVSIWHRFGFVFVSTCVLCLVLCLVLFGLYVGSIWVLCVLYLVSMLGFVWEYSCFIFGVRIWVLLGSDLEDTWVLVLCFRFGFTCVMVGFYLGFIRFRFGFYAFELGVVWYLCVALFCFLCFVSILLGSVWVRFEFYFGFFVMWVRCGRMFGVC